MGIVSFTMQLAHAVMDFMITSPFCANPAIFHASNVWGPHPLCAQSASLMPTDLLSLAHAFVMMGFMIMGLLIANPVQPLV